MSDWSMRTACLMKKRTFLVSFGRIDSKVTGPVGPIQLCKQYCQSESQLTTFLKVMVQRKLSSGFKNPETKSVHSQRSE